MFFVRVEELVVGCRIRFEAYDDEGKADKQDTQDEEPRRTRIALGPQITPSYPGSDDISFRPLFDLSHARGDEEFAFEAPDEGFGFALLRVQPFVD